MFQSQSNNQSQFSFHIFSLLTQLIQISQSNQNNQSNLPIIKQIQQNFIQYSSNKYDLNLFHFLKNKTLLINNQSNKIQDISNSLLHQSFKNFLNSFCQTKIRISNIDNLVQNLHQVKILVADKKKAYSLKQQILKKQLKDKSKSNTKNQLNDHKTQRTKGNQQEISYKAFIIYGKAINVQRNKKLINSTQTQPQQASNLSAEDLSSKQQTISHLQFSMTKLYEQQKLPFIKSEPHDLQDILLTHSLQDSSLLPILVTHEVYRTYLPIDGAIILVIPQETIEPNKQQIPFIVKNTVLHVYMDNYKAISKLVSKQSFFKNTTFRGIYFVEEGQVQTKSGRVVARGWVISGKCKSTTQAWRFTKTMSFFKFILQNQNVWKQFANDLKLNGQWPIKISDLLNLDEKVFDQMMGQEGNSFKLNSGNNRQKRLKFPPITARLNKSFDISKLSQIQKMKHYDEKINQLREYKQEMLKRKIEYGSRKSSLNLQYKDKSDVSEKQMNKRIQILSQKMNLPGKGLKTDVSRSVILRPGQSSANILITGIVNKLKSMHESTSNSIQKQMKGGSKKKLLQQEKSNTKILGLRRYQQLLKNEKYHIHKGRNFYN